MDVVAHPSGDVAIHVVPDLTVAIINGCLSAWVTQVVQFVENAPPKRLWRDRPGRPS